MGKLLPYGRISRSAPGRHAPNSLSYDMTNADQCGFAGCGQAAAASLSGESFCRNHFISACYARLDQYEELRKGSGLDATESEAARRFIHECTRSADEIEHTGLNLDNLDRAKLLHIILSANELGRQLRRSPRKVAMIPVRIASEKLGAAWEEDAETELVSRYGAMVRCQHAAKVGETLVVVRTDTGEKALARVAWQRPSGREENRIGVEFFGCENFWGLEWGAVEEGR
jgi:hypothetical protein